MVDIVTIERIMGYFQEAVEKKEPMSPSLWVDAAGKLTVLLGDENDKLFDMQQEVAQLKVTRIGLGDSVAKAEATIRATDSYKYFCKQKARIEQVLEFIRVAKLRARITETEFKG